MDKAKANYDSIIACIGNSARDETIVTAAYNRARAEGVEWKVLHITEPKSGSLKTDSRAQRMLRKARVLQAEVIEYQAESIENGIMNYADSLNTEGKKILFMVGVPTELKLFPRRSTYTALRNQLNNKSLTLEPVQQERIKAKNSTYIFPIFNFNGLVGMFEAVIYVCFAFLATLFMQIITPVFDNDASAGIFSFFYIACILTSIRGGLIPGILSIIFSGLNINFFFYNDSQTLAITNEVNFISLSIFTFSAIILCFIGNGTRIYLLEARQKEAYLNALLSIGETLNRPLDEKEALAYIHNELEQLFSTEIAFFTLSLINPNRLILNYPARLDEFKGVEKQAFEICRNEYMSTGTLTSHFPDSDWYFEPMMSSSGFEGILAIKLSNSPLRYDKNILGIMLSFSDLSATIIDRIQRTQINEETRITEEKEKLRTMLLSSVSHDLKTPLASIIGSLDVYHSLSHKLTDEAKASLTQTSYQEAIRLDNFITNILDMAKLETGSIKLNTDWIDPDSLISKAINSASRKLGNRSLKHNSDKTYEINVDLNLMLRALSHLFDNISKYTPDDSNILIEYSPTADGNFLITIQDEGPGIADNMLETVFNKYTRISQKDSKVAGTGLGLPLSRAIIGMHNGSIIAQNNAEKGVKFLITLPCYREVSPLDN